MKGLSRSGYNSYIGCPINLQHSEVLYFSTYIPEVVLLTNSMDTRPYRLNWPTSTIILHKVGYCFTFICSFYKQWKMPDSFFLEKPLDVQAKIPRSLFLHVPLESSTIQQILRNKGFTGNRIWHSRWLMECTLFLKLALFFLFLCLLCCFYNGCPLFCSPIAESFKMAKWSVCYRV